MILVTGGTGYIGSHTLIELDMAGLDFIVYDNLSNSTELSIKRVEKIIGKKIKFVKGDIRNKDSLNKIFTKYNISSVIHFAGLKAVAESVKKPLYYYDNNVIGTIRLLEVMQEFGCKQIVFSSSATVYGNPKTVPITEDCEVGATTNPYGTNKYIIEKILQDLYISDNEFKIIILRYFNPVGAHESGLIGEDPNGIPNNLMPYISQVAVGKLEKLSIFGNDYNTKDGTGIRDYIHVVDLSNAHAKAVLKLKEINKIEIVNLGTGIGYSVLDIIESFNEASGKVIPYIFTSRRAGDISECYSNPAYAEEFLGWNSKRNLFDMCKSSWNWQNNNPNGYSV